MKKKGFTLIELLVVIAIIGLLLAIITPALKRAKEYGKRIICQNNLKSFTMANVMYANQYDGAYVPIAFDKNPDASVEDIVHWIRNDAYRALLDFEAYGNTAAYDMPDDLLCPADRISKDPTLAGAGGVLTSYAYNVTDWGDWYDSLGNPAKRKYIGHKVADMTAPANRLAFIDAIDWWLHWNHANYEESWDRLGQASIDDYLEIGVYSPVMYRHSEGANIGFYDGHVEYKIKENIFVKEDWEATPQRPGMWVADITLFYKNN